MRLEEILTSDDVGKLSKIAGTSDWSFNNLLELSGLDPKVDLRYLDLRDLDLRGADLRGCDFTGSDLRGCLKDSSTAIDSTTTLLDAQLDWIEIDEPTIVQKMSEVENAGSRVDRRGKLTELLSQYRSPDHIRRYLRNLVKSTRSVEAFFDYLDFFEPKAPEDVAAIVAGLRNFSIQSVRTPGRTRRYLSPSTTSFSILLDRMSESDNQIAVEAFNIYLSKLIEKGRQDRRPQKPVVEEDFQSLLDSIQEAGGQFSLF